MLTIINRSVRYKVLAVVLATTLVALLVYFFRDWLPAEADQTMTPVAECAIEAIWRRRDA